MPRVRRVSKDPKSGHCSYVHHNMGKRGFRTPKSGRQLITVFLQLCVVLVVFDSCVRDRQSDLNDETIINDKEIPKLVRKGKGAVVGVDSRETAGGVFCYPTPYLDLPCSFHAVNVIARSFLYPGDGAKGRQSAGGGTSAWTFCPVWAICISLIWEASRGTRLVR